MLVVNLSKAKHILYPKNICDFRAYKVLYYLTTKNIVFYTLCIKEAKC